MEEEIKEKSPDSLWIDLVQQAYDKSTSYLDNNYRKSIEDSIRHFQSRHHAGSKYNKPSYNYRSKRFVPKTRAVIRNNEAAMSAAFFANLDMVSIEPQNSDNPIQVASADVIKALVEYRLQNSIPWYLTCIGAGQEVQKVGVVCSYQDWFYREKKIAYEEILNDVEGNEVKEKRYETVIDKDEPRIRLIPVENVRFHPSAEWTDPINTSPFLQILWPMYVKDIKERMKLGSASKTGETKWKPIADAEIQAVKTTQYDPTRSVRETNREDKYDIKTAKPLSSYDIVWVIENFFSTRSGDVTFFTLGTKHLLSDPVPIEERHFTGERPVVMGLGCLETFKVIPDGLAGITKESQFDINEITNQRRDNVSLAMNKRYFIRRGAQVNIKHLVRNVAGGGVLMNDPKSDVIPVDFNDVTRSAYMEQDRANVTFDELAGGFSQSSVMTNRSLNETVGGMRMMRSESGSLVEYLIKTFAETWVEPVIKQLVKLEQKYETDMVILSLAAQKARLYQKYGVDRITDELLNQDLVINVSAGLGSSDPTLKLERLLFAIDKFSQVAAMQAQLPMPVLNLQDVGKEVFGRLGYKDGTRFTIQQEEGVNQQMMMMVQQLQQAVVQLQQQLADKEADRRVKVISDERNREAKLLDTQIKQEGENKRKEAEIRAGIIQKMMDLQNPVVGEKAA